MAINPNLSLEFPLKINLIHIGIILLLQLCKVSIGTENAALGKILNLHLEPLVRNRVKVYLKYLQATSVPSTIKHLNFHFLTHWCLDNFDFMGKRVQLFLKLIL